MAIKFTKTTRRILDLLVRNPDMDFTQDEIVEKTGLSKSKVNRGVANLKEGKLIVVSRKIKINTPPYRRPFYRINEEPKRIVRARELVVREDA